MKKTEEKNKIVHIRLSEDMFNMLATISEYNGMSVSAYIRMCLDYVIYQVYSGSANGTEK